MTACNQQNNSAQIFANKTTNNEVTVQHTKLAKHCETLARKLVNLMLKNDG